MSPLGSGNKTNLISLATRRPGPGLSPPWLNIMLLIMPPSPLLYGSIPGWLSFKASLQAPFPHSLEPNFNTEHCLPNCAAQRHPQLCATPCSMPPPPPTSGLSALKTSAPNAPSPVLLSSWGPYCNAPII